MLLIIDNYDSFTYNLVQYFQCLNQEVLVFEHDKISLNQIKKLDPQYIVISPGPKSPDEAGISLVPFMNFIVVSLYWVFALAINVWHKHLVEKLFQHLK